MNMKRSIIAAIVAVSAAAGAYAAAPFLNIFRNDDDFNRISLTDGVEFSISSEINNELLNVSGGEESVSVPLISVDSLSVKNVDIPSLYITFTDYPEKTQVWDKDLLLNATMQIDGNGDTADSKNLTLQVKGRGNTTWGMPKKPMRLKFEKKTSICGFKKAKNYVLLANYIDFSHCRNAIALTIASKLGIKYTNHFMPCNEVMMGSFF